MVERVYTEVERKELEQRIREGEWLTPGQIAAVLKIARSAVHGWLKNGRTTDGHLLGSKPKLGSRHRIVDPKHVAAILDGEPPPE